MIKRFCIGSFAVAVLAIAIAKAGAASAAEAQAFSAAEAAFKDTFYARSEKAFAEFAQSYPASPLLTEAMLLQARSRLEQSNYAGALELFAANQNLAGARKDEFVFWTGETRLRQGSYAEASKIFAQLPHEFPSSPRRVEAAVKQALCAAKLNQWQSVVELLSAQGSIFQAEAGTNNGSQFVLQGYFLLSEAYLKRSNYVAAQSVLEPLGKRALNATNAWARNYLLCQVQSAAGNKQAALDNTTNLLAAASKTGVPSFVAESTAMRAELLESLARFDEAIAAYANNLAAGVPVEWQRQAVLKATQLLIIQHKSSEAAQLLEKFLAQSPQAPGADAAWMQLGELRLRQFVESLAAGKNDAGGTNAIVFTKQLQQAIAALQTAVTNYPKSEFLGLNFNHLAWSLWFAGKTAESRDAFQKAIEHLSPGPERSRALFKLGDASFGDKDYPAAITNYQAVLNQPQGAAADTNLFEPALYQIVRAGLAAGNLPAASNALSRIVSDYPKNFFADRATLLFGQRIGSDGNPAKAREVFQAFLIKIPDASLKPELELATARTYEQENSWSNSVAKYGAWLQLFTNHPARPEAMFCYAQAFFHSGDETNAYNSFTNFVAQYPNHPLMPQAQWWLADYHFNAGAYVAAESEYQVIAAAWPRSEMGYEALMMAGRCAYLRQGWKDAIEYFVPLARETNCSADLHFRAVYAYGDTLMSQVSTNKEDDYRLASTFFDRICQEYSTNYLAALACGEKAKCLLQLANSGTDLANAADAFTAVITNSVYADGTAKSIARVGLGVVREKQAAVAKGTEPADFKRDALDQYLNVLYGVDLKGTKGDEFWTKVAGSEAVRLASEMGEWEKVLRICDRIAEKVPQIAPAFEEQKRKALESISHGKIVSEIRQ